MWLNYLSKKLPIFICIESVTAILWYEYTLFPIPAILALALGLMG